jgi:hypothetical protein
MRAARISRRMPTDFSVFRERLAEACRIRGMTCRLPKYRHRRPGVRALDVHLSGLRALDLYRVCQIADRLDVSVDWLLNIFLITCRCAESRITSTSILPGGAEMKGVLSARPSTINPGPPRRWIHFHTGSVTMNRERIHIRESEAHSASFGSTTETCQHESP